MCVFDLAESKIKRLKLIVYVNWIIYNGDCKNVKTNKLRQRIPVDYVDIKFKIRWVIWCIKARYKRKVRTDTIAHKNNNRKFIVFIRIIPHRLFGLSDYVGRRERAVYSRMRTIRYS